MPVGARRTQSMPSKYMIPSSNIGEYEAGRRKSAPAKPPHLFPLDEEGTYGMPPKGPAPAPKPFSRERKTKIYSSYSVDKSCNVHAKQLAKVEEQRNREMEEQRAQRRRKSFNTSRWPSASPSRASSEARSSKSPEPRQYQNGVIPSSNMGEYEGGRRKSAPKKSSGSDHGRKMTPTTGSGYSSSSFQTSSSRGYSSSSSNGHKISGIREENEDYTYQENRKHSGYSKYADGGLSVGMSGISLNGLRKPNIDSWDSMGILGLSSRMWSDTKKQQETFMTSTGQFLREENYNSHIM